MPIFPTGKIVADVLAQSQTRFSAVSITAHVPADMEDQTCLFYPDAAVSVL